LFVARFEKTGEQLEQEQPAGLSSEISSSYEQRATNNEE